MGVKTNLYCDRCGKLVCKNVNSSSPDIVDGGWETRVLRLRFQEQEDERTQLCGKCSDEFKDVVWNWLKGTKKWEKISGRRVDNKKRKNHKD